MNKLLIFAVCFFSAACFGIHNNAGQVAYKFNLDYAESKIDDVSVYESKFSEKDFSEDKLKTYSDEQLDYILDTLTLFKNERCMEWRNKVLAEKSLREEKSDNPKPIEWYAANLQNDYISKGMIENAFALQNKYHNIALPELPDKIIIEKSSGNIGWRVYDIEDKGKTVILKNSIFDKGSHIIMSVSWGCEFAEMAMEVIITNPWLKDVFMRYGSILGKSLNIKSQWDWKQQLGINKVYSRYKDNEIKSLQTLDSPHFFFMQDGEVVYDFSGVFQDEENLGLTKRFKEGLNLLEEAANSGKNQVLNLPNISKENSDVEKKNIKRKSPFFVAYCDFFNKARDWQVLKFLNKMFVLPNNCVAPASVAGIGQNHTTKEMGKIISDIRFCKKNKKEQNLEEAISMFKLLKNVSPSHKVEFAQSIITKDGHIISAYIEGIEKDLGKAKAKKIAAKLAGQEPQFDTVCEISENAETGEKTIKTASKKGYFCLAE